MNLEDYQSMVTDILEALTMEAGAAAERNTHKDRRGFGNYVKGWEGFNLHNKFLEEFKEVVENPTPKELGDLAWVCAMMLDQYHSKIVVKVD